VDADLSGSTTTAKLGQEAPERLVNVGIAEQNMIDVAAGLALAGKTVFTGSFAVFGTGRVYDQIRNTVCYANLDVKIAPTHAGISVGPDGGSHQMVEDIALMRVLPNMRVLVPADYNSAAQALRIAAATAGPVYVRLGRAPVPQVYSAEERFALGQAKILRPGTDATIVACGCEVSIALAAAQELEQHDIHVEVIDAFSIKPLDEATILQSARRTRAVVTAEEHSVIGGLGSAVAEALASHNVQLKAPLECVGVQDRFGTSGQIDELFTEYGLDQRSLCAVIQNMI